MVAAGEYTNGQGGLATHSPSRRQPSVVTECARPVRETGSSNPIAKYGIEFLKAVGGIGKDRKDRGAHYDIALGLWKRTRRDLTPKLTMRDAN